jgi:hypothetical protein
LEHEKKLCPHCDSRALPVTRIAGHVVAIMNCPCKEELIILYRDQIIPLKRSILEDGSFEDRKEHLGEIAARVFEWGLLNTQQGRHSAPEGLSPISEEEIRKFVRVDLRCLDNAAYFRRHFCKPGDEE